MPVTYKKIASVTVGSGGAADIEFTSIPGTYTDLVLKVSSRDTSSPANPWQNYTLSFNGTATNTNWTLRGLAGTGSAAVSESQTQSIGQFSTPSTATASTFANGEIYIPNYAGSTNKLVSSDSVTENNATAALAYLGASLWSNTAAITSIKLTPSTGSFVQHSTATLYGISKS